MLNTLEMTKKHEKTSIIFIPRSSAIHSNYICTFGNYYKEL